MLEVLEVHMGLHKRFGIFYHKKRFSHIQDEARKSFYAFEGGSEMFYHHGTFQPILPVIIVDNSLHSDKDMRTVEVIKELCQVLHGKCEVLHGYMVNVSTNSKETVKKLKLKVSSEKVFVQINQR